MNRTVLSVFLAVFMAASVFGQTSTYNNPWEALKALSAKLDTEKNSAQRVHILRQVDQVLEDLQHTDLSPAQQNAVVSLRRETIDMINIEMGLIKKNATRFSNLDNDTLIGLYKKNVEAIMNPTNLRVRVAEEKKDLEILQELENRGQDMSAERAKMQGILQADEEMLLTEGNQFRESPKPAAPSVEKPHRAIQRDVRPDPPTAARPIIDSPSAAPEPSQKKPWLHVPDFKVPTLSLKAPATPVAGVRQGTWSIVSTVLMIPVGIILLSVIVMLMKPLKWIKNKMILAYLVLLEKSGATESPIGIVLTRVLVRLLPEAERAIARARFLGVVPPPGKDA